MTPRLTCGTVSNAKSADVCDGRTGAGRRRRVGQGSIVAVFTVAAPRALAVVEAVRRTARALEVLRGRLVEATAACC